MIKWIIGKLFGADNVGKNRRPVNVTALKGNEAVEIMRKEITARLGKLRESAASVSEMFLESMSRSNLGSWEYSASIKAMLLGAKLDARDENFRRFIHHMTQPFEVRLKTLDGDVEVWQFGKPAVSRQPKSDTVEFVVTFDMVRKFRPFWAKEER